MINLSNKKYNIENDKKLNKNKNKNDSSFILHGIIMFLFIGIICTSAYSYGVTSRINDLESKDPVIVEKLKNESLAKMKAEANVLAKKEFEAEVVDKAVDKEKDKNKSKSKYSDLNLEFLELVRKNNFFNVSGALLVSHDTKEYYILQLNSYDYNNWTLKSGDKITIQKLKDESVGLFSVPSSEFLYKDVEVNLYSTSYFEEDFK